MQISSAEINKQIYHVRGTYVMLDSDLAKYYQIETRNLNQTVRRHIKKFPDDFMFQITKNEFEILNAQIVRSQQEHRGGRQKLPPAFTEQGVGMLSCILDSDKSIQFCILAVRAFAQSRHPPTNNSNEMLNQVIHDFQEFKQLCTRIENKLDMYCSTFQKQFTTQSDYSSIRPPLVLASQNEIEQVRTIFTAVAKHFGLKESDLKNKSRIRAIAIPRQIAIFLIRKHIKIGFNEIGKYFGGKNHTTILHAFRKISNDLTHNRLIIESITTIENNL